MKKRVLEKDPDYSSPPLNQKIQHSSNSDYIINAFKKAADRMDSLLLKEDDDPSIQDRKKDSSLENFYRIGEENSSPLKEKKNTTDAEQDYNDIIEKAHEVAKAKDPRTIYTEFRKRKHNATLQRSRIDESLLSEEEAEKVHFLSK